MPGPNWAAVNAVLCVAIPYFLYQGVIMADKSLEQALAAQPPEEEGDERGPRETLDPREVLERIRRGATVQNARIENLRLEGEFTNPVRFRNCHLVKPKFDEANFLEEVSFKRCTLEKPVFNGKTVFAKNLEMSHATLVHALLCRLEVGGNFNAEFLHVRGKFDCMQSQFKGEVRFWEAHFEGWVQFKDCDFHGDADFRSFIAAMGFVLRSCKFLDRVRFRGASVAMKLDLTTSRFEKMLDLSRAKLNDYVYLEQIEQGHKQRFAFENTLGERVLIRPEQLKDRMESEVIGDYHQAAHEYAFLKRCFAALHRHDQEDWAYYRFKVCQRRAKAHTWWRPWQKVGRFFDWLLLDVGCAYGTNPMRAVRAAVVIMILFALIYSAGIDQFYLEQSKLPFPDEDKTSFANRTTTGFLISTGIFTSGMSNLRELARGWMNLPLMVESVLGTLLWGLFIVAFSRKVIR